jgi:hypothetical protein
MKTSFNEKQSKFGIIDLTPQEFSAIRKVMLASVECFEELDADGNWMSNESFICSLQHDELAALRNMCCTI